MTITFHASPSGGEDYLDFDTADGARFYLRRDEARALAQTMLAAEDVVCAACERRNGLHAVTCTTLALKEDVDMKQAPGLSTRGPCTPLIVPTIHSGL
jgi:hypothetical protein